MQGVTAGHTAVNYVLFQNDGNIRDYFLITAPSGGDGWTVNYFNDLTNENITPYLTDGTHNASGWLEPQGTSLLVRIEITPDSTVTTDSIREVLLTVVSKTDSSKGDAVKAVARVYPSNLGDLNNDSLVNENDADLVLQYVFGERDDLMSAIQALASQVGFPDNPPDIRVAAWILSNCQPR